MVKMNTTGSLKNNMQPAKKKNHTTKTTNIDVLDQTTTAFDYEEYSMSPLKLTGNELVTKLKNSTK